MAQELSRAHGTVVIDGDFTAFDANSRKALAGAKKLEEGLDSLFTTARKQLDRVGKGTGEVVTGLNQMASAQNKAGEATKKSTKLTFEQRKELELLRRETKLLAEQERVNSSARIQTKRGEVSTLIQEEHRLTNAQIGEMRKRQQALRGMMMAGPSGSMAASASSMFSALPGMTAFGSFHSRFQSAQQRAAMVQGGMTPSQALNSQINQTAARSNANYLLQNAIANAAPPVFGGGASGGGRRGGGLGGFLGPGGLGSRMVGGLRGGLGAGLGVYAGVQAGRAVVEASELATAYDRQRVAAERLAGSQAGLNALLDAYSRASGGAVDNVTALEQVVRLQATGFAKNAAQVERFVRGTRGSSIALGKPQDYITQEAQLAISNTSVKRLDQIGLGIAEVADKTEQLRDANKDLTREMAFGEAVITLLNEKYGTLSDTAEGQATSLEKLRKSWSDLRLEMGQNAQNPVNQAASFLNSILQNSIDNQKKRQPFREDFTNASSGMFGTSLFDMWGAMTGRTGLQVRAQNALDSGMYRHGPRGDGPSGDYVNPNISAPARFSDDELATFADFQERRTQIEEQYNQERLRETENYEQQRATTVRNFAKQMAREEEDFARSRARSTRDYNKQIADFHEDSAKRDADMLEDYNDAVSKMREDSEEKVADLQKKYNDDREKAEKDHLDRLMSAAGQLNAVAVLEERKRYRRENEEREKAFQEQMNEARESLEEQKEEAREAYEERLQDAKEADEERLRDMQESRDQQLADEDEDRAIRNARAAEDHADQLEEMDRQHQLRLKQIADQAQAERDAWEKEFEQLLLDMGIYVKGLTEKEEERNKLIEEWFDKMIDKMEKDIETQDRFARRRPEDVPEEVPAGFANGGPVRRSGLANVHRGEFVLSRGMLSGRSPIPASVAGAMISNSNSRRIDIAPGAINISSVPGDTAEYLADLVEDRLVAILERA